MLVAHRIKESACLLLAMDAHVPDMEQVCGYSCSDNCLWWCAVVRIILGKQPLDCDPVKLFSSDCMHWDWRLNLSLSFLLSLWFKWGRKVYSSITFNRTSSVFPFVRDNAYYHNVHLIIVLFYIVFLPFLMGENFMMIMMIVSKYCLSIHSKFPVSLKVFLQSLFPSLHHHQEIHF